MIKCTLFVLLAAIALSSAVPVDVYKHIAVNRWPYFGKTYGYGYNHGYGYPYHMKHIYGGYGYPGVHHGIYDDVYRYGVHDIDDVVPVHDVYKYGGDINKFHLKNKQYGQLAMLQDEQALQHHQVMEEEKLLHDLEAQQHAQWLDKKIALDHLHRTQDWEVEEEKEKLSHLQFLQKMQLDKLHSYEDAKVAAHYGYGYPYMHKSVGPYAYSAGIHGGFPWGIRNIHHYGY